MKVLTIGRNSDNDIVVNDNNVSRYHCQIIQHDDGNYSLSDVGSTNGTFVNGQRIYGEVLLSSNDIVRIGNTLLPWKNYFNNPETICIPRPVPSPEKKSKSSTQTKTMVLGVLGAVFGIILLILAFVWLFSRGNTHNTQSSMHNNDVKHNSTTHATNNYEPSERVVTTYDEPKEEKTVKRNNISGKWEWQSEEEYEVETNDLNSAYTKLIFTLSLEDDGNNVTGEYFCGTLLRDVLGDSSDGGTLHGRWDGEKYIVKWKSTFYVDSYSGEAIIRPISPQLIEFIFTTVINDFAPNYSNLKKVVRFTPLQY